LLRNQFAADFREADRNDFARIRGAERDTFFPNPTILIDAHEQGFARKQPFAGPHQRAEKAAV
jgi:hypothetical protein